MMKARRLASLLAALGLLPGVLVAQEGGQRCELRLDHADRGTAPGQNNYFAAGDVRLRCAGTTVRIRSDSLASYASQIVEFIGNVRYEDSSMVMTAHQLVSPGRL